MGSQVHTHLSTQTGRHACSRAHHILTALESHATHRPGPQPLAHAQQVVFQGRTRPIAWRGQRARCRQGEEGLLVVLNRRGMGTGGQGLMSTGA